MKCSYLWIGIPFFMACSAADIETETVSEDEEVLTIVHLQGATEAASGSFLIDTRAYTERGAIVPLRRPPTLDGEDVGRQSQELVLAAGYGDQKGASSDRCGPPDGDLTTDCVVPLGKSIVWAFNTNTYYEVFSSAQAVADATAWSVKPFVTPGTANLIVFQDNVALPGGALAMTVSQVVDSGGTIGGKKIYRHNSTPLEIHFHVATIESFVSGSTAQKQLQRQHVFCHELGHAMGLPHNGDGETSCMQASVISSTVAYSAKEQARLNAFIPGNWTTVSLLFL